MKEMVGSLVNRIMEDTPYPGIIEVGTRLTECLYTDRRVYEVVDVVDQKHVFIREMRAVSIGQPMTNQWRLESDENNPLMYLTKRGKYWYYTVTVNLSEFEKRKDSPEFRLFFARNGYDESVLRRHGKQTRYYRMKCCFGVSDYYYDYSF